MDKTKKDKTKDNKQKNSKNERSKSKDKNNKSKSKRQDSDDEKSKTKRPLNPYMQFQKAKKEEFKKKYPNYKWKDLIKKMGEAWAELSE